MPISVAEGGETEASREQGGGVAVGTSRVQVLVLWCTGGGLGRGRDLSGPPRLSSALVHSLSVFP